MVRPAEGVASAGLTNTATGSGHGEEGAQA
jgi:hypothetical protein